ncbi:hypothetical protein DOY81_005484 [Sarcophaga bullata]|nr:hypothetical protein DOY81_005484 [Sarcophaga bullata]
MMRMMMMMLMLMKTFDGKLIMEMTLKTSVFPFIAVAVTVAVAVSVLLMPAFQLKFLFKVFFLTSYIPSKLGRQANIANCSHEKERILPNCAR